MKTVVAFVGFKGSGKNTAAEALLPYDFAPMSFADALKDALSAIFCWDRQMLEGVTPESRHWREQVDQWWADRLGIPDFTPRWALLNVGTQVMRKHFNEHIWTLNVERRLTMTNRSVVLIDSRFPNEVALARRYGAMVYRIRRGPDPWWINHAIAATHNTADLEIMVNSGVHESEWAWLACDVDGVIDNNGTIDELHQTVRWLVIDAIPANNAFATLID